MTTANICKQCGHENPTQVRICVRCAAPLVNLCPKCGFENPSGFRYCGSCGTSLLKSTTASSQTQAALSRLRTHIPSDLSDKIVRASQQAEGERRNVTILFADVVGFTTLSEKLDPEQVYNVISKVQQAFLAEVYAHEGWFDKFLGDGFMAIFGAPVAHEDDAVRAVRAALGVQRALKRVNDELDPQLNVTLRIRIGLNAGVVVMAAMGSDMNMNYTPLGDAVNVAARLQALADPGSVIISRAVYDQVKPQFDFRERGWVHVKGRIEPVEVFQVLGAKQEPGRARGIIGLNAPMIGRSRELLQLTQHMQIWLRGQGGLLSLLSGEAGIGKSRLTAELRQILARHPVTVVEGECLAYGQLPYEVFVQIFKRLLGVKPTDDISTLQINLLRYVNELPGVQPNQILPYLAALLSIQLTDVELSDRFRFLEPSQLRQQIFVAVRDVLLAQARQRPLVLIFEDLHWVDNASLDLLLFLANSLEDAPLWLHGTTRPITDQLVKHLDAFGREQLDSRFLHLVLQKLSLDDSTALLYHLELPVLLKQMIPQRAGGNPLFLEEMVRMLIDRGYLQRVDEQWQLTKGIDLDTLEVPRTLQGLIMARVDSLEEKARAALQCAAVIGQTFNQTVLRQVMDAQPTEAAAAVQILCANGLVMPVRATTDTEFTFHHVLIQETVYESMLQKRRERLHLRIAESIEQIYRERIDEHIEPLSYHFQHSGDTRRALPYLMRAGQRAASRYANDEALNFYRAALDILTQLSAPLDQKVSVYIGMGDVQFVVGHYENAIQSYRSALEIVRLQQSVPLYLIADLGRKLGRVYERKGDYDAAKRWLEMSLEELDQDPRSARAVERVRIYLELGWLYYRRGEYEKAFQWRMHCLEICEGTHYYMEMASAYNGLVPLLVAKGDWARALAYGEKGLVLREKIGDTEGLARSYLNLGTIAGLYGDWPKAIDYNERALTLATRIQLARTSTTALNNLGNLHMLQGELSHAHEYLARALQASERSGDVHLICTSLCQSAALNLAEARVGDALAVLERSLALAKETGNKTDLTEGYCLLAETQLASQQVSQAKLSAHLALEIAQQARMKLYEGRACRVLGAICHIEKDYDQALAFLFSSAEAFEELNLRYELALTQYETAAIYQKRGEHAMAHSTALLALATLSELGAMLDREKVSRLLKEIEQMELSKN